MGTPGRVALHDIHESDLSQCQREEAPANPTVAATIMQSMLQRNDVAIKAMRALAWLNPSPTTTASWMSVSY